MSRPPSRAAKRQPPFVGALLRMSYRLARQRQLDVQISRGFSDLTQAHLSVLVFPPPDGVTPTELAERTFMTKQAMNYLLGQLEALGYIERRSVEGRRRVLVYLTPRGWKLFETQGAAMQQLEDEWAAMIGQEEFDRFLNVLRRLSSIESTGASKAARGDPE